MGFDEVTISTSSENASMLFRADYKLEIFLGILVIYDYEKRLNTDWLM